MHVLIFFSKSLEPLIYKASRMINMDINERKRGVVFDHVIQKLKGENEKWKQQF